MGSVNVTDRESEEHEDDYSLGKVPYKERKMGWFSITNITFGIATAIFYFQLGSVMALQFGAINALISAAYAIIVAGIMGTIISYLSARSGMNVNNECQFNVARGRIRIHRCFPDITYLRLQFHHVLCLRRHDSRICSA